MSNDPNKPGLGSGVSSNVSSNGASNVVQNDNVLFGGASTRLPMSTSPAVSGSVKTGLQDAYVSVKDGLNHVTLPEGWKIRESLKGISSQNKDAFYVVKDAARYSETALKYLLTLNPDEEPVSKQDICNLVVILRAQLELLEDKYATLRVKSATTNKAVGTLFESQLAGTSGLSQRHLDTWNVVSQLASHGGFDRDDHRTSRGRGRGRPYWRGRGKGNYHGSYQNRGNFNGFMRDISPNRFENNQDQDS